MIKYGEGVQAMRQDGMVLVYSTFPNEEIAEQIARQIVEAKLAACANIFAGMRSIYEWQRKMECDDEVVVLFKTIGSRREDLSKKLRDLHPYDTPAIFGIEPVFAEAHYLAWLQGQLEK